MPVDEVKAIEEEKVSRPPATLPAPAELSQEAQNFLLLKQISEQQAVFQLMISQTQVTQINYDKRLAQLELENVALKEKLVSSPTVDDLAADWENYLHCGEYSARIAPGISVHPPSNETERPHLFDLHVDKTFSALQATGKHKAALEEYKILYCMTYYLSCSNQALKECIEVENQENAGNHELLSGLLPLFNTFGSIEGWFRKRLGFIRAQHTLDCGDAAFIEFLRGEIYEEANAAALGSQDIAAIAQRYSSAQGKANLQQAAKLSAARKFSAKSSQFDSSGTPAKKAPLRQKEKPGTYVKAAAPTKKENS